MPEVDTLIAPAFYALQQAREDLAKWTEELSAEQIWSAPPGLAPLGFQLRHIAGSTERLATYLEGKQLSEVQMRELKAESDPGARPGREELLARVDESFRFAENIFRGIRTEDLREARGIGRKQLPTTVMGLLVHIAEHTHRHVGQAIVTARVVRAAAAAAS